ncbi:MAG TPA: BON domain-containing protein [Nitrospirales bacterium]|nr:BON domain-containing protein [Nitrospirales bacterium]
MKTLCSYGFMIMTGLSSLTGMTGTNYGQMMYVPEAGFDASISREDSDPQAVEGTSVVLSDEELESRIQRRLKVSPFVNGDVTVQVEHGVAVLSGSVDDRHDMADAVEIAYDSGATNVTNRLRMRDQLDHPWREMTDRELKQAVEDELYWSPFVNSLPIRVEVRNGIVTVSGRVENQGEIADVVENAYEAGAKNVLNRLWIDPTLD